jgi:nicotinamidase-related amidase
MLWPVLVLVPCLSGGLWAADELAQVRLRSRVEVFKGSGQWQAVEFDYELPVRQTALIICDMWDQHWCRGASTRVEGLVLRAQPLLDQARGGGILIIHAPSETMEFYRDAPQRQAILAIPRVSPPTPLEVSEAPLPVDASGGGCDTPPDKPHKAWTRQHPGIRVGREDLISDKGEEVYSALRSRGLDHLLIMGVHTNMCILNRSFAIRQMTRWGVRAILIRDLTDAMYNPQDAPWVSHAQGTELVIQHIEKYWCPTVLSGDLARALARR